MRISELYENYVTGVEVQRKVELMSTLQKHKAGKKTG
jgi:hypothetical protein